ncbi:MAG: hypothetical protein ABSA54_03395 [Terriglobales bacterium]|jgi:hypothetical protein
MKLVTYALLLVLTTVPNAVSSRLPHVEPNPQFSADLVLTGHDRPAVYGHVFFGGQRWRFDVASGGRVGGMIFDFAAQTFYVLLPQMKLYMEFHGDASSMSMSPLSLSSLRPLDPSNPCAAASATDCKRLGSDTVDGRPCDNWQSSSAGITRVGCLDKRIHVYIRARSSDGRVTELHNIREEQQPENIFQVPADYRKLDANQR